MEEGTGLHVLDSSQGGCHPQREPMLALVEIIAIGKIRCINEVKFFNRWTFEDVGVNDLSLADYIAVSLLC